MSSAFKSVLLSSGDDPSPGSSGFVSTREPHMGYPPKAGHGISSSTLYMPIASPPTPAPSPRPNYADPMYTSLQTGNDTQTSYDPANLSRIEFANLAALGPASRKRYLVSLLNDCTPSELLFISTTITPMLKRDFLMDLPPEIAFHVLNFINEPQTLVRVSQVCKRWNDIVSDEWVWKTMCERYRFDIDDGGGGSGGLVEDDDEPLEAMEKFASHPMDAALQWLTARERLRRQDQHSFWSPGASGSMRAHREMTVSQFSYRKHFQRAYLTMLNWRRGGHLLRVHRMLIVTPDGGVITSVALDSDWVVVGLANSKIHVFSAKTGVLSRTLTGHELGVWAVHLVSRGGYWQPEEGSHGQMRRENEGGVSAADLDAHSEGASASGASVSLAPPGLDHYVPAPLRAALGLDKARRPPPPASNAADPNNPGKPSDLCCSSEGWGQPNALIVSGGCDKYLRVWDVKTGHCIYILRGHTSTIRCIQVLHNRPIAVTGSRDSTLRVWNIQRGRMLHLLQGHQQSVRCLDVCGNRVVSGSYDATCRIWNVDTGECLHVLRGHNHQIYSVAFDGVRVASGGMDTSVRVWDPNTGQCIALLQGHTALVCQLQLSSSLGLLATGGSDGRVITFSLKTYTPLQRIAAHDSSVTSLQFDSRFLVTGGNDGRVRLYETQSGTYVRDLSEPCESVWKVACKGGTCAIMCKRAGKTVMEFWTFKPKERL
ncbi:WD40 repeat-like protein [Leucogyrophana mollusca]|uniref:WD40 repeat-like protein n=1 Tax=Leucogyrophana mollusca TaxID=85980 RepID=A0ACB8B2I3_9AGAM|nr:WD40 repeat-like protein [Leucogyrophana mollusca]